MVYITYSIYSINSHDWNFLESPVNRFSARQPMATQLQGPGLMSRTLSLPTIVTYDNGHLSDSDPAPNYKFPHTRAQLSAIARQHKPLESYDADNDGDEYGRISSSLVSKVVTLLDEEQEDELKTLLKDTYGMDDEAVSI
jgi:hypothetical protein